MVNYGPFAEKKVFQLKNDVLGKNSYKQHNKSLK